MIDFRLGMVVEDTTDNTKWIITKGHAGQYNIGVYWTACQVVEFNPDNEKFTVNPVYTRGIDDHDTSSGKYEFICMTKTVTLWYWDTDATYKYQNAEKEKALESARKKLTPEEFRLLTGGK